MDSSYSTYRNSGGNKSTDFNGLSEKIGSSVQKITQNVSSLKKIISQLGTAQDTDKLRAELHHITHYTNELAKDTRDGLQKLRSLPKSENVSEQRTHKVHAERLTNDFTTILQTFQTLQRDVASKTRDDINQSKRQSGSKGYGEDRDSNLLQLESPVKTQMMLQKEEELQLEILHEQEEAMHQLESDIVGVNEIFRDLATMVHEQGEIVDSIESNVESAVIQVEDGRQQLSSAEKFQTSLRKKKLCLIIFLIIVIAIIIGIIIWQAN